MNARSLPGSLPFRADALFIHPVKACAGVRVPRLAFDADGGVCGDREWVVVDAQGEVTWQGAHPRLARVAPRPSADGLVLEGPGTASVAVHRDACADSACPVHLWNDTTRQMDTLAGEDAGDDAARLLAHVTGAPLRLVRLGEAARRRPSINPVHVVFAASLRELDLQLAADGAPPAAVARLRPNIVLGADDPNAVAFIEEQVIRWTWGAGAQRGALEVTGPCVRCIVPNVDPDTAAVSDATLQALVQLGAQRHPGAPVAFGVYARASGVARLAQGERLAAELSF